MKKTLVAILVILLVGVMAVGYFHNTSEINKLNGTINELRQANEEQKDTIDQLNSSISEQDGLINKMSAAINELVQVKVPGQSQEPDPSEEPTPSPEPSPEPSASPSPTPSPTPTPAPTVSPSSTPAPTPTAQPTVEPTATPAPPQNVAVDSITVSIDGAPVNILDGDVLQMNTLVEPWNATRKDVMWRITEDSAAATISQTGLLTVNEVGTVTVRASALDGSEVYGEIDINVKPLYFTFDSSSAMITGYDTAGGKNVIVPSSINGVPVTGISNSAFIIKGITSLTLPEGITVIEGSAFTGNELVEINLPDSLTTITHYAFSRNELESVTIPIGVTSIGAYAFNDNEINRITIYGSNVDIGENIVGGDNSFRTAYLNGGPGTYVLTSGGSWESE